MGTGVDRIIYELYDSCRVESRVVKENKMDAIHLRKIVERDGEIVVKGLPFRKGESVEVTVSAATKEGERLTARKLLQSELVGIWKDRKDLPGSAIFARQLRERAQKRD